MPFWQSCMYCTAFAVIHEKTQGIKNVYRSDTHEKIPPSVMLLVPFTLVFIMALFSLIIEIILPAVISFWLAGWVYTVLVGQPWIRNIYEPFWFIRTG